MTGELFQPNEPLVNYNYGELSTSIGWITLYPVRGSNPSVYILTSQAWDSDPKYTETAVGTTGDYDFDMTVGRQLIVGGKTQISFPWHGYRSNAGSSQVILTIKLRKYSGGVETDIVSATSPTTTWAGTGYGSGTAGVILNIPETIYRRGDILRITVEVADCQGGANSWLRIYHDPRDAVISGTITGACKIPLPTKINQ